jgi:spermidine synthase
MPDGIHITEKQYSMKVSKRYLPTPFIYEDGNLASLLFSIGSVQSEMDKNNPDRLMLTYTETMMGFLLFNEAPRHIGMIGLGGGSLAKYCYRYLPRTRISVAEINEQVIDLRQFFQVPQDSDRFLVLHQAGEDFVQRERGTLDVLIVDGFGMFGQAPELISQQFYQDCYYSLSNTGILVVNYCDSGFRSSVTKLRRLFDEVFLCDCPDGTNKIAFAMKRSSLPAFRLTHQSKGLETIHPINLSLVEDQLLTSLRVPEISRERFLQEGPERVTSRIALSVPSTTRSLATTILKTSMY